MDFETWRPIYKEILADLGYSEEEDERSAGELARLLHENKWYTPLDDLRDAISGKHIVITGGGITDEDISRLPPGRIIATGRSIPLLLKYSITPFAIVTDLDGDLDAQKLQCERGSIPVIHAHGNNIHLLPEVKNFPRRGIGTCQCRPIPPLHNFGGFTDGDRAAALAAEMHAARIILAGFRFDNPVPDTENKRKKLAWAEKIIGILSARIEILYLR